MTFFSVSEWNTIVVTPGATEAKEIIIQQSIYYTDVVQSCNLSTRKHSIYLSYLSSHIMNNAPIISIIPNEPPLPFRFLAR
jgi:hypothetical protein